MVFGIGQFEFEFSFFGAQNDRLAFHAADHVKRSARLAAQSHLQEVLLDAGLHGFAQLGLDLEETVRRTQAFDALVRTLVIVIFDPELDALTGRFKALELGALKELLPEGGPEALDLAQGHGMVRPGFEMRHPVFLEFGLEARSAAPGGVLPAVVGEHFLGRLELAHALPIHFDHRLRRGAAEQIRRGDEARVIVEEGN